MRGAKWKYFAICSHANTHYEISLFCTACLKNMSASLCHRSTRMTPAGCKWLCTFHYDFMFHRVLGLQYNMYFDRTEWSCGSLSLVLLSLLSSSLYLALNYLSVNIFFSFPLNNHLWRQITMQNPLEQNTQFSRDVYLQCGYKFSSPQNLT